MALTPEQQILVNDFRALAAVTTEEYSDDVAIVLIKQAGSPQAAAASVWRRKAASYAELVDITEGSSSRKLSGLYKQALEMAGNLDAGADVGTGRRAATTRPIERV